ncbi:nuclear transport factor 2 family protein [Brevundimonas sp. M20]|uniref:nuclear transport factor 2 family protein n=1 Tax=Brevundimonas sp. M20 TaxID=2591463 RepID=UPI001146ECCF|nr:nuclear transport factor 2 family protein [Brevundimonas sp. M20]QDH73507.1 nuclear transport factor 2 family protein [Brevundimonas sp. M20]
MTTAFPRRPWACLAGALALAATGGPASAAFAHAATTAPPPAASSRSAAPGASITENNRRLVTAAFDRWAAGRGDFFETVLSPDVVWTIEGSGPSAGTFRGRDHFVAQAVTPFSARLIAPVRPLSHRVWADGDHVIVNWVGETTAADGASYRNTYAWILRLENGRAVEVNAFLDLAPYDDILRRVPLPAPVDGGRP